MTRLPIDPHKTHRYLYLHTDPLLYITQTFKLGLISSLLLSGLSLFLWHWNVKRWSISRRVVLTLVYPILLLVSIAFGEFLVKPMHNFYPLPPEEWEGKYQGFHYHTDGRTGWILQGVGLDGKRDLLDLTKVPLGRDQEKARQFLIPYTYDPSNGTLPGTFSSGDLFRVGP